MTERIEIEVTADTKQAIGEFNGLQNAASGLHNILEGALKIGIAGVAAGFTALTAEIGLSVKAAMESEEVTAQLNAVLESTGGIAGITAEQAQKLATELQGVTRFSDETVLSAENMLLTFTNIGQDVFPQATKTVLDMATALGEDTKSAAIQLGKALQDPIDGVTALRRVGVNFTEDQRFLIEQMVKTGNVAEAQLFILKELQTEFGGSAEAAGKTFAGQLDILKNKFDDIQEGIGNAFIPVLQRLSETLMPYVDRLLPLFADLMKNTVAPALDDIVTGFGTLLEIVSSGDLQSIVAHLGEKLVMLFPPELRQDVAKFVLSLLDAVPVVEDIADSFDRFLGSIGSGDFSAAISNLSEVFLRFIPNDLVDNVAGLVLSFYNLKSAFVESAPQIQQALKMMGDKLSEVFGVFGPQLVDNLSAIVNSLAELWRQHGTEVLAIVVFAFDLIVRTIGGALTLVSGILAFRLQLMAGDSRGAWQTIADTWATFMNLATGLVGSNFKEFNASWAGNFELVKTIASAAWQNVVNTANNLVGQFKTIGKNMIQGIIDGILSGGAALINAITNTIQNAIDSAENLLGIQSPSKLFAEIGANISKGMSEGIVQYGALPSQAMLAVSHSVAIAGMAGGTTNNTANNNYGPQHFEFNGLANTADVMRTLRTLGAT